MYHQVTPDDLTADHGLAEAGREYQKRAVTGQEVD
jgi:hypothetical protein